MRSRKNEEEEKEDVKECVEEDEAVKEERVEEE